MQKPGIPKGTRDFGPEQMAKRSFIFSTIKQVFEKYGFLPLETPAMENLNVLLGKYGDEGDRLLFKILNSGDFIGPVDQASYERGSEAIWPKISKKGLKYDLTVPFARYVVMHQNELAFPFKRYQIQPVWRADRPQKGRYQEFYQCDADVIGTDSLLCESEIVWMITEIFQGLGIQDYTIRVNHRKLLAAIAEQIGAGGKETDLFVAIDKLDKIGLEKVLAELRDKGFTESSLQQLTKVLAIKGSPSEVINKLEKEVEDNQNGRNAIEDLQEIVDILGNEEENSIAIDVTLARGLSYYTGAIFEVALNDGSMGSLSGGGRYDDLTGVFGLPNMSGVGFSLGVDRIYDVMITRDLFPEKAIGGSDVLVISMGKKELSKSIEIARYLRGSDIKVEVYPDPVKLKKQMNYANRKAIPYVIIVGEEEIRTDMFTLKNMNTGEQSSVSIQELIRTIKRN